MFSVMKKVFFLIALINLLFFTSAWSQQAALDIRMDSKLQKIIDFKKKVNQNAFTSGQFTIQLFYGNIDKANKVVSKFNASFPNQRAELFFETPNYKVRVGKYTSRLEATKNLQVIKRKFPAAFLLVP
jgi:septal ring-binding cell division protein DamX